MRKGRVLLWQVCSVSPSELDASLLNNRKPWWGIKQENELNSGDI
jgi:hypothetical protein